MIESIAATFVPLFVAVDAVGVLPIFVSMAGEMDRATRNRIILQSMATASGLALGFILIGQAVFRLLGITMGDFMIAGGVILFCLAVLDLVNPAKTRRIPSEDLGVVPLGTPMIAGPAVLTTSLLMVSQHGVFVTSVSLLLNVALAGLLFSTATVLVRVIGEAGAKALSKIVSLLLAAIAVMLIRRGLEQFLA